MDTLVRMNADEINNSIIDFIRLSFKGKKIALHIYEDTDDETEYLLSDPIAKKRLLESAKNATKNISLKEYSVSEIENILNDAGK